MLCNRCSAVAQCAFTCVEPLVARLPPGCSWPLSSMLLIYCAQEQTTQTWACMLRHLKCSSTQPACPHHKARNDAIHPACPPGVSVTLSPVAQPPAHPRNLTQNPIPKKGTWSEVSGDDLLRKMLAMVLSQSLIRTRTAGCLRLRACASRMPLLQRGSFCARGGRLLAFGQEPVKKTNPYTFDTLTIDPKNIARRVLDIRVHLAKEWTADLKWVAVGSRNTPAHLVPHLCRHQPPTVAGACFHPPGKARHAM